MEWLAAPADFLLPTDEVHVWRAFLGRTPSRLGSLSRILSSDELARAEQLRFASDRNRFIIGRGVLRTILGRYLKIEPSQVEFHYGTNGKPILAPRCARDTLNFNVSHSGGLFLCAVTRDRDIGVDVERIYPIRGADRIATDCFSPQESTFLCGQHDSDRLTLFFNCWTRKEAFLKALGHGLAEPLDQFEVSLAPGDPGQPLRISGKFYKTCQWSLQALVPAGGYAAALAVRGMGWRLRCWEWAE